MRTIISTTWFKDMLVSGIMGIDYTPIEGTTINEYLDIPINDNGGKPVISHYTLGISKLAADAFLDGIEHSPIDITLYEMVPLLLIDQNVRELTTSERAEYSLIKELEINGTMYTACYAKRIDTISNNTRLYKVNYDDVNEKYDLDVFKFTDGTLGKPIPKLGKDYMFDNNVPSIALSSTLSIILSLKDIDNLANVLSILYPNSSEYITDRIFEVGIVASNADEGYYQHTHYCKVNKFLNSLTLDNNNIAELDIGSMSPVNI